MGKEFDYLNKISNGDLKEFLELYHNYEEFNIDEKFNITKLWIKEYQSDGIIESPERMALLNLWVDSGRSDYGVYDHPDYISEIWLSWRECSRRLLKSVLNFHDKGLLPFGRDEFKTIIDLGGGFGYSTLALSEIYPNAEIYMTQLEDTHQYKFANDLFSKVNPKCHVIGEDGYKSIKADMVMASEFFEHLTHPVDLVRNVVNYCDPKVFMINNTFNVPEAIGHFEKYYDVVDGEQKEFMGSQMTIHFNRVMRRELGYNDSFVKFYNASPKYWIRDDIVKEIEAKK